MLGCNPLWVAVLSAFDSSSLDLNFAAMAASGTLDSRVTYSRASSATRVNASGVLEVITSGNPRFTYDPVTLSALGLLIEEQRSQLLLNSLIDGTNLSTQTVTVVAVAHTLSFYGTGTVVLSGAYVGTLAGSAAYPTRSTLTFTPTAGSLIVTVTGTVQYAQLEAGAFATSFIASAGASVTRAADSATMTGSNFSSWFNATQGTFAVQWSGVSATTAPCGLMSVNDGTSSNKMDMRAAGGQTVCAAGGALQWAMVSGAGNVVAGKGAFSYATNAGNFCMNGLTVQNDASVTVPSANKIQIGALDGVATNQPNGAIARLRYYNTALTNAQLQALTT